MIPDEEEPERLKRRWDREEGEPSEEIPCPSCGAPIGKASFYCLFCGERVFEDSGFLGALVKNFKKGGWVFLSAALLAAFLAWAVRR